MARRAVMRPSTSLGAGPAHLEHPAVVRLCHWLSALATVILIASGLEIFAAYPTFVPVGAEPAPRVGAELASAPQQALFTPPDALRLGGWLGGALQWHLTFAWIFLTTGVVYAAYQAATGNYRQVLFSRGDSRGVWPMVRHYFFFGPRPSQHETYNPLQKLAYTTAITLGLVLVATGLALYKPVQLSGLLWLLGGVRLTRMWHFAAMTGLLAFIPGHLIMVAVHGWANFASMFTGWTGGPARNDLTFDAVDPRLNAQARMSRTILPPSGPVRRTSRP